MRGGTSDCESREALLSSTADARMNFTVRLCGAASCFPPRLFPRRDLQQARFTCWCSPFRTRPAGTSSCRTRRSCGRGRRPGERRCSRGEGEALLCRF